MIRSRKGLLGLHPILLLAIIGAFTAWAFYKGYLKWKGPRPAAMAKEVKNDVTKSVKKLTH